MGDRKEPNWPPGHPRYTGPPQVRPAPPPAPPPRLYGPVAPAPAAGPAAGAQAPAFGALRADLRAAARLRCPAGCGGSPAVPGRPSTCGLCEGMADFALEVLAEMVRQGKVLMRGAC